MSDPSFERSRLEEYHVLYFENKILQVRVNNRDCKPIFHRFFSNILVKFFCKGSWLVYSNIIILKFVKNYSNHKVSYKCSSNYYHFSSSLTFIFVNRVFSAFFSSL